MKTAIYPGSFDPITNGHLDIITRSACLFDKVIVGVTLNLQKNGWLSVDERVRLIQECVSDLQNVEVCSYDGLTADFAKQKNAVAMIRGVRNYQDFEYEKELSYINQKLNNDIQTIFLQSKPEYCYISSSGVKELLKYNSDISDFVPKNVCEYILNLKS